MQSILYERLVISENKAMKLLKMIILQWGGNYVQIIYISQLLMLGIVVWTGLGAGTIAIFINAPSLIIVFVFALLFL